MTERKIGPFILGKQIGAGGMGVVYKATYTETGKEVALKVLPPGLIADAKLLKRLQSAAPADRRAIRTEAKEACRRRRATKS